MSQSTIKQSNTSGNDGENVERKRSLLSSYNELLEERPLVTKSITSGVVAAFGAALGSMLSDRSGKKNAGRFHVKWLEVITFALHGCLVGGPVNHYWSKWLEDHGPESTSGSFLLDQLVVQPQLLIAMHVFLDMSRAALREFPPSLYRTFSSIAPAIANSWQFWPFVIYCTLRFLKKKHHPVALNVCSVAWTMYLAKRRASSNASQFLSANEHLSTAEGHATSNCK